MYMVRVIIRNVQKLCVTYVATFVIFLICVHSIYTRLLRTQTDSETKVTW